MEDSGSRDSSDDRPTGMEPRWAGINDAAPPFPSHREEHHSLAPFPDRVGEHQSRYDQGRVSLMKRRRPSTIAWGRRPSITRPPPGPKGGKWWKFILRPWDDDDEQDWWFAGTAIPLLAATFGPLANVLSIAALVTSWRMCLVRGVAPQDADLCQYDDDASTLSGELEGQSLVDPRWCYWLNVTSLIMGFVGNLFLLLNFTKRIRYIVALPVTISMWSFATGILIGITISMEVHVPPVRPQQTYTQGFWYAVLASCLYLICSSALMVNMLGYFLGHYPQHFNSTDSQRTLISQTTFFFIWLAGGSALFSNVESRFGTHGFNWSYVNALYFCDVTILTVGFGDLYPSSDIGRGLVIPYSVGGVIMLGLIIESITKFASELGSDKVIYRHLKRSRARTFDRTTSSSQEIAGHVRVNPKDTAPIVSAPSNPIDRSTALCIAPDAETWNDHSTRSPDTPLYATRRAATAASNALPQPHGLTKKPRSILLREGRDRFNAMRASQHNTTKFKHWTALLISTLAFGLLWCGGAIVFWRAERRTQDLTYFQASYFCYVSLLTIGYGDLAPRSNIGRPFFVLWSLLAVPTMTISISHMGDTVLSAFNQGTFWSADFTISPRRGVWKRLVEVYPSVLEWLQRKRANRAATNGVEKGFEIRSDPEAPQTPKRTRNDSANGSLADESEERLAVQVALAIRRVAGDMKMDPLKSYSYEEWIEYTRLIRFTVKAGNRGGNGRDSKEEEGLIEWDWIGEDSPMMVSGSEPEFILARLCESMVRYIKGCAPMEEVARQGSVDGRVAEVEKGMKQRPGARSRSGDPGVRCKVEH